MHPKSLATDAPSAADAQEGALPPELLRGFEDHGLDLSVPRATVVVREGEVADRLYLVREGRLRARPGA
jgi:CRP-like cAMP-binding protein